MTSRSIIKRSLSRRSFLGGAGATLGLPFLESREGRAAPDASRFVTIFLPCGVWVPFWVPASTGPGYTLSPTLTPLASVKSKLLVLSGLQNNTCSDNAGAHNYGPTGMLSCRLPAKGSTIRAGVSIDQVVAQTLAGSTRIPSLQLGVTDENGGADNGYAGLYRNVISWANDTQPLAATIKPDVVFDQIFAGQDPTANTAERAKRRALRTSVLDYTLTQAKGLAAKLAASDRLKLEEYTSGIRDLERQIQTAAEEPATCATGMARPGSNPAFPDRVRLMTDLTVLAFQCDSTRVISLMLGCGGSGQSFGFIGIPENHHPLSHHQMVPETIEKIKKIDLWEVTQIAALLEKMDAVSEGSGTLLDNSVVLVSSEISDGDRHNQSDKPMLVAGRAGGLLSSPGQHIRYKGDPQANLFITLANLFGAKLTTFGADGNKPLVI